jgi:hypothetical protein
MTPSNVYYLPLASEPLPVPPVPRWTGAARSLRDAWWRVRMIAVDVVAAVRRPRPRRPADDLALFLGGHAELVDRRRPRPAGPARVIDLAAARGRRRAVAGA